MVAVSQWFDHVQHHTGHWNVVRFLKDSWLFLLLLLFGACAFVTAVIIAYPVLAHVAAKFFQ